MSAGRLRFELLSGTQHPDTGSDVLLTYSTPSVQRQQTEKELVDGTATG